ncbi:TadE/TadG family type IV pilus assembly protein [Erwinia sp.]|uniref:TadE/TadG family type IV pilus assembly protein n=1 Tax=Erwinia citreus TaxID=558 RepID=UPI003C77093F
MNRLTSLFINQRGAASIEFAFTLIAFLFMVFFIFETARLAYISAVIDLAVSEAAKEAKNAPAASNSSYRDRFSRRLTEEGGVLWRSVTTADAVQINITYSSTLQEMISTGGSPSSSLNKPIARYQLAFRYTPMFFPFPEFWATNLLVREVIFVQEYERSKFMH